MVIAYHCLLAEGAFLHSELRVERERSFEAATALAEGLFRTTLSVQLNFWPIVNHSAPNDFLGRSPS
jgi:hypothetical protein